MNAVEAARNALRRALEVLNPLASAEVAESIETLCQALIERERGAQAPADAELEQQFAAVREAISDIRHGRTERTVLRYQGGRAYTVTVEAVLPLSKSEEQREKKLHIGYLKWVRHQLQLRTPTRTMLDSVIRELEEEG